MRFVSPVFAGGVALALALAFGGFMAASGLTAASSTGTVTACASATAPGTTVAGHTVAVDTVGVKTIPSVTVPTKVSSKCVTATYTVSTVTTTVAGSTTASGDTTPPTVRWTNPLDGQTISGVWGDNNCDAAASDNVGIDHVDFFVDGVYTNTERQVGYACQMDTATYPNGPHVLKATAYDAAGNSASTSITVTFSNGSAPPPTTTTITTTPTTTTASTTTTTGTAPSGTANVWVSP